MVYVEDRAQYVPIDQTRKDEKILNIWGPSSPPAERGTGHPSGSPSRRSSRNCGASTRRATASHRLHGTIGCRKSASRALLVKLLENGAGVTLLDGDLVRRTCRASWFRRAPRPQHPAHRLRGLRDHQERWRGCARRSPYAATRRKVRQTVEPVGGFIEVHVSTPIEVCEQRPQGSLCQPGRVSLRIHWCFRLTRFREPRDAHRQGLTPTWRRTGSSSSWKVWGSSARVRGVKTRNLLARCQGPMPGKLYIKTFGCR